MVGGEVGHAAFLNLCGMLLGLPTVLRLIPSVRAIWERFEPGARSISLIVCCVLRRENGRGRNLAQPHDAPQEPVEDEPGRLAS